MRRADTNRVPGSRRQEFCRQGYSSAFALRYRVGGGMRVSFLASPKLLARLQLANRANLPPLLRLLSSSMNLSFRRLSPTGDRATELGTFIIDSVL